jgi:hypothetical protein
MPEPLHLIALAATVVALAVAIRCAIDTRRYRTRAEASADRARQALAQIKEIHTASAGDRSSEKPRAGAPAGPADGP